MTMRVEPLIITVDTHPPRIKGVGDLRMLGMVDGFAHAIVRLRQEIGDIKYHRIDSRHVRKIAARESKLRHLIEIDDWLVEQHHNAQAAYRNSLTAAQGT